MLKVAVDNAHRAEGSSQRHKLLATVHIARKQLAMQDDDYAALLERVTGKRSAADCSDGQLRDAIREFEAKGFRSSSGRSKRRIVGGGETVRKARAMWISLYQLGAIRDGSDAALEALGRRQLKVDRLVWANERHANRLIEALKAMADRAGWDQRVPSRMPTRDRIRLLKDRLVGAQLAKLAAAGVAIGGRLTADRAEWTEKQLERAASELARHIRALPENEVRDHG